MKEKPIIFSTEMVKAVLDGRKTQTRRMVKLKEFDLSNSLGYKYHFRNKRDVWNDVNEDTLISKFSPYGKIGGRLWVRESFAKLTKGYIYKADEFHSGEPKFKWKPSIHLPRTAARILLEITNIRVERLQDISEEDAKAEGVMLTTNNGHLLVDVSSKFIPWHYFKELNKDNVFKAHYAVLWDSINYKKYPWKSNPWVWIIVFKKI